MGKFLNSYPDKVAESIFKENNLHRFDDWWSLEKDWFEEPNERRGGWSGVSRLSLPTKTGADLVIFLKRQENHIHKSFLHPIKGVPTFRVEYHNILRLNKINMPTVESLYYAERKQEGKHQVILILKELTGYSDLLNLPDDEEKRKCIMKKCGLELRRLHESSYRHTSIYSKHIFYKIDVNNEVDIRFIDLEKLTWRPGKNKIRKNEIFRFFKRKLDLTKKDLSSFLEAYLNGGEKFKAIANTSIGIELLGQLEKVFSKSSQENK
jgi:hypothetical protein